MRHPAPLARRLAGIERTLVMGIVNVTPDSFSDGGALATPEAAISHGLALLEAGADLLDVGGESTRPGAVRIGPDEEWDRIGAVVRELAAAGALVSVDTMWAATAARALDAGALIVNDVSGGLADPGMIPLVAASGVTYVAMHWRAHSEVMDRYATYTDVVGQVCDELTARVDAAVSAGVTPGQLVLDPGLGFAKDAAQSWEVLRHLDRLVALGHPVLVGASRKRFLAEVSPAGAQARDRDPATAATSAWSAAHRAWAVRVHDAAGSATAVRTLARLLGTER